LLDVAALIGVYRLVGLPIRHRPWYPPRRPASNIPAPPRRTNEQEARARRARRSAKRSRAVNRRH
jgi:hypothetical protein